MKRLCYFLMTCLLLAACSPEVDKINESLEHSKAIWIEDLEHEMNCHLGFKAKFNAQKGSEYKLALTASEVYRIWLNGEFLGYGPARAAHGFFRVDHYDLTDKLKDGENIIAIEVNAYNVNSFYTIDQFGFLQAEISEDDKVILATGKNNDFIAMKMDDYAQKTERYSFQRPFTEFYNLNPHSYDWRTNNDSLNQSSIIEYPKLQLLERHVHMPDFKCILPIHSVNKGTFSFAKRENYYRDRSLTYVGDVFKGYKEEELVETPSQWMQEIVSDIKEDNSLYPKDGNANIHLCEKEFHTYEFSVNMTGFIGLKVNCLKPSKLVLHFDEMLTDGDVYSKKRLMDVNNQVIYNLEPGNYNLECFEPYTMKFLKLMVLKGECQIEDIYLREYIHPDVSTSWFKSDDYKLNAIFDAAKITFRQNAMDVFMDCPSRERAGWLCDSYFASVMEKDLTGEQFVSDNFLQNYALPDSFAYIPKGMVPMCYPADHTDHIFIPNWAMWFIIHIDDYAKRGGNKQLIKDLRPRVEGLMDYFKKFENEDGLLVKLDSWIFVEWSDANNFVHDLNYPTNMLYSAILERAGKLYGHPEWIEKSEKLKKLIKEKSFNGEFFVDNAVKDENGKLINTQHTTEVCQYYAFYFDIATPETYPKLWNTLLTKFGPNRDATKVYPNVNRANAFLGNYMRISILSRYHHSPQIVSEIKDYFYSMTEITGTLWEFMEHQASCNHGFAAYMGHIIYTDILGINKVDYKNKEITLSFSDVNLNSCSGSMPLNDKEAVELSWTRENNVIYYNVKIPKKWTINIENHSKSKIQLNKHTK